MALSYNPSEPMPPQMNDWTCAACSLAWANRALGIDYATTEIEAVEYIGNPENINSEYGLMDGSGAVLAHRLREQGAPAFCSWPSWDEAVMMASRWPLLIGGVAWNHWVGVRNEQGDILNLANSAEGWQGIYTTLDVAEWTTYGPFAVVAIPLLVNFPPT